VEINIEIHANSLQEGLKSRAAAKARDNRSSGFTVAAL
jgi:hypothetical protein